MQSAHCLYAIHASSGSIVFPAQANSRDTFTCAECKEPVILRRGEINRPHFAHHAGSNCTFYSHPNETQLHKDAKSLIKRAVDEKLPYEIYATCMECKSECICELPEFYPTTTAELEYSFRQNESTKSADVACGVLNSNKKFDEIQCIFEICHTHKTCGDARPEPWFEFDAKSVIQAFGEFYSSLPITAAAFSVQPVIKLYCIRSNSICEECKECAATAPTKMDGSESDPKVTGGKVYFNQRGAGCGKTYESIQLIQKDGQFDEKTLYIYLTKMHTVKEVVYNEFKEQEKQGKLENVVLYEDDSSGNQYKLSFRNKTTDKNIQILIGTIDSFKYAVVDQKKIVRHPNYFQGIVKTIACGFTNIGAGGCFKYAGDNRVLNNQCLIIVDEAQDLGKEYLESFKTLIDRTQLDVYVIGDKLQSIWDERNLYTCVENQEISGLRVDKSDGVNKVMRFHNAQFQTFVNNVVPFEQFKLPPISGICDGTCRKYKHEDDIVPYCVFKTPYLLDNNDERLELNDGSVNTFMQQIANTMEREIDEYNYLPHNFMFIIPFPGVDRLVAPLSSFLQQFWMKKFSEEDYQTNVLAKDKDEYWCDKIENIKKEQFYQYVFAHKNEEGRSINLKESERATRILSIHASKGLGCEVVFVLNLSESALMRFSYKSCNLVYESLLHVAITRQKKKLYIGLSKNDELYRRFSKITGVQPSLAFLNQSLQSSKLNASISPSSTFWWGDAIKKTTKLENICRYIMDNNIPIQDNKTPFDIFSEHFLHSDQYKDKLPKTDNNKKLIDWGHHTIRFDVMIYYLMANIINTSNTNESNFSTGKSPQIIKILDELSKKEVREYKCSEYNHAIYEITENNKKARTQSKKDDKTENKIIPILSFGADTKSKYAHYTETLKNYICSIQRKIRRVIKQSKLPELCPVECVVLMYAQQILEFGIYCKIHPMDIYSIFYCYDCCANDEMNHSAKYECICSQCFESKLSNRNCIYPEIQESICNHYDNVSKVNQIYANIQTQIVESCGLLGINDDKMKYNIDHRLWFKGTYNKEEFFNIMSIHRYIAYSKQHALCYIIKPQFNVCNFNEIICEAILTHFMIQHSYFESSDEKSDKQNNTSTNYERYANKTIHICLITLDTVEPIFFNFDFTNEQLDCLKQIIKSYFQNKFTTFHDNVHAFYKHCVKTKKDNSLSSIAYAYIQLVEYAKSHGSILQYVVDFFNVTNERVREMEKSKASNKKICEFLDQQIRIKENCIRNLDERLLDSIDEFLGIRDETITKDY